MACRRAAVVAGGVCAVVGIAAFAFVADDAGLSGKSHLRYIVEPHPDDAFQAWGLITGRQDAYHVFILLTHGERSVYCSDRGHRSHPDERTARPQPLRGSPAPTCAQQRIEAWHAWHDAQAQLDTFDTLAEMKHLRRRPVVVPNRDVGAAARKRTSAANAADWYVGRRSARIVFDLGDGTLTPAAVAAAVDAVRRERYLLPPLPERDVIAAAYYNRHPDCLVYEHPDHEAVHRALWHLDLGVPGAQLAPTCRANADADVDVTIPDRVYRFNMAVATDSSGALRRVGAMQRLYGWLAFDGDGYWSVGTDNHVLNSRSNAFWFRFGRRPDHWAAADGPVG